MLSTVYTPSPHIGVLPPPRIRAPPYYAILSFTYKSVRYYAASLALIFRLHHRSCRPIVFRFLFEYF